MDVEHRIVEKTKNARGEDVDVCLCNARWSHPPNRSEEEKEKIYKAHVSYFKRPATRLD